MFELILAVLAVSVIAVVGAVIFWDRVSPETSHKSAWLAAAVAAGFGVVGLVEPVTDVVRFDWVPLLGLGFEFTLDSFAALFLIILGGVGAVVSAFTVRYQRDKSGSGRFIATMLAFAASMNYPRPLPALRAGFGYLGSLVRANARMAYQVLAVRAEDLMEKLVVCDLETGEESVAFFDANATNFSPGTLTLEISQGVPYRMVVHAMGQTADEVKADVSDLEDSASRMFE